ncbi:MAG: hypothetical protein Ct9H300mP23_02300 [Nitrospinota bacterium]|nr:MAG: hypothetical protein Ct9H300mP23_02300 [Nitrospinota bacterium]
MWQTLKTSKKTALRGMACLMAIQNIENIEALFKNAAIGLKPQCHLVFVMTHPCFRTPKADSLGLGRRKKDGISKDRSL